MTVRIAGAVVCNRVYESRADKELPDADNDVFVGVDGGGNGASEFSRVLQRRSGNRL